MKMRDQITQLRKDLALCECWHRAVAGYTQDSAIACVDFTTYLKHRGLNWCPPCQTKVALEKESST
jgi:hypothetical protein